MNHDEIPKRSRKRRCQTGVLAADITREQAEQWFHLPSHEASTRLGVSLSVLKRVCRRLGIRRWPYRMGVNPCKPQQEAQPQQLQPPRPPSPTPTPPVASMPSTPAASTRTGQRGVSPQPQPSCSSALCSPAGPEEQQAGPSSSPCTAGWQAGPGSGRERTQLLLGVTCPAGEAAPASHALDTLLAVAAILEPSAAPAEGQQRQGSKRQGPEEQGCLAGSTQLAGAEGLRRSRSSQSTGSSWKPPESWNTGAPGPMDSPVQPFPSQAISMPRPQQGPPRQPPVPAPAPPLRPVPRFATARTSAFRPWFSCHPQQQRQHSLQHYHMPQQLQQGPGHQSVQPALPWGCVWEHGGAATSEGEAEASLDPVQGIPSAALAGVPAVHPQAPVPFFNDFAFESWLSGHSTSPPLWGPGAHGGPAQASFRTAAAAFYPLGIPHPGAGSLGGWGSPSSGDGMDGGLEGGGSLAHTVCLPRATNSYERVLVEVQQRSSSQAATSPLDDSFLVPSCPPSPFELPAAAAASSWGGMSCRVPELPRAGNPLLSAGPPHLAQQQQQLEGQQRPAPWARQSPPAQGAEPFASHVHLAVAAAASPKPIPAPSEALARLLQFGAGLVASQPDHPLAAQLQAAVQGLAGLGEQHAAQQGSAPGGGEPKGQAVARASPEQEREQQQTRSGGCGLGGGRDESRRRVRQKVAWECLRKYAAKYGYRIEGVLRASTCTDQAEGKA